MISLTFRDKTEKNDLKMAQSYHAVWIHLVWATKNRQPLIVPSLKFKLYDKFREIAKDKGYHLDFVNGIEDHVHLLVGLHPKFSVSTVVKNFKGISHTWIRDNDLSELYFNWQDGYAAFSVSPDRVPNTRRYIERQEEHHRATSFDLEWRDYKSQAVVYKD